MPIAMTRLFVRALHATGMPSDEIDFRLYQQLFVICKETTS